jgi:hypothetical protein
MLPRILDDLTLTSVFIIKTETMLLVDTQKGDKERADV